MSPLKDLPLLIPVTCDYVRLHGKGTERDFVDVIQLSDLKIESGPWLTQLTRSLNLIKRALKNRELLPAGNRKDTAEKVRGLRSMRRTRGLEMGAWHDGGSR